MKKILLSLMVILLVFSVNEVNAEGEDVWGYTKYTMNVRNAPDGRVIGTASKYTRVSGTKHSNGWIETSYGNWIYSTGVEVNPEFIEGNITKATNLRAVNNNAVVEVLNIGDSVSGHIVGEYIVLEGGREYLYNFGLEEYVYGFLKVASVVRSQPNSNSNRLGTINKYDYVVGYTSKELGNWIKLDGAEGYIYNYGVYESFIGINVPALVIRERPSSSSRNLGIKSAFTKIELIKPDENSNWLKIVGEPGYIYNMNIVSHDVFYYDTNTPYTINVRNKPNGNIVETIKSGGRVRGVSEHDSNWIQIGVNKYVYNSFINDRNVVAGFLNYDTNIRSIADGKVVKVLPKNTYVMGVTLGNKIYIGDKYIFNQTLSRGDINSDDFDVAELTGTYNVKKYPSESSETLFTLTSGSLIHYPSIKNGWMHIDLVFNEYADITESVTSGYIYNPSYRAYKY